MSIKELIDDSRLDLSGYGVLARSPLSVIFHAIRIPGARLILLHRLQLCIGSKNPVTRVISSLIFNINYIISGCNISRLAKIHGGVVIPHPVGIVIGNGCEVKSGCWIYQNATLGATQHDRYLKYPLLEDGCQIMPGACVFGDVVLAPGTRVGANSVLMQSTEPNSFYIGAPAKRWEPRS